MSMCHGFDVDVIPSHTRHPPKRVWEGHGENIRTRPRPVLTRTRDPSRVTIPVHQQVYTLLFRFFMLFNLLPGLDKLKSTKVQKLQ